MDLLAVETLGRYESIEALFSALTERALQVPPAGGCVMVHPALVLDWPLAEFLHVHDRVKAFGLHLVVTPAVASDAVELRRYLPPPSPASAAG